MAGTSDEVAVLMWQAGSSLRVGCVIAFLIVGIMAGGAVLTKAGARGGPQEVSASAIPQPDLEVFMDVSATPTEVGNVANRVRSMSTVRRFAFLDHTAALAEFQQIFHDQPELLQAVQAAALPESFRLDLARSADVRRAKRMLGRLSGVDSVIGPASEPTLDDLRQIVAECRARDYQVEVFMRLDASSSDVDNVRDALALEDNVTVVRFLDHDAALRQFRETFANRPKLRDSVLATDLPESFQLRVPVSAQAIVQQHLGTLAGVDSVHVESALCRAVNSSNAIPA